MTNQQTIVIAGGSGFVGSHLARRFAQQGYDVLILSRQEAQQTEYARYVQWDGNTLGSWYRSLENTHALINLAGKSINTRHTAEHKRDILQSRLSSVRVLNSALLRCQNPPAVWIQASAQGIYGDASERICVEDSPKGSDFLAQVCLAWEQEFEKTSAPIRKVILRLGIVLGPDGGALQPLARLTTFFLGGSIGNGQQYMSWIQIDDLAKIILWTINNPDAEGPYNALSPLPETNARFMKALRKVIRRPWTFPAPAFAVEIAARIIGTEPSIILKGQKCIPQRLLDADFAFEYPDLEDALRKSLGK